MHGQTSVGFEIEKINYKEMEGARLRPNSEFPSNPGQAPALSQARGRRCQVVKLSLPNHEPKTLFHVVNIFIKHPV